MSRQISALTACCLALAAAPQLANSANLYDEIVDPEISDDHLNPTPFGLAIGFNDISGTMSSANGIDREYLVLTIPEGAALADIDLISYITEPNEDQSFLGIAAGNTLPDPDTITGGDLDGALLFGAPDMGSNLLDSMNGNLGSNGFSTPLPAGNYTMWIQETGAFDIDYMFSLEVVAVPEPSAAALLGLTGLAMLRRRR